MKTISVDVEKYYQIANSQNLRTKRKILSGILQFAVACYYFLRMLNKGFVYYLGDERLINSDALWYLIVALLFLISAYRDLVVSKKDILLKLLVDDYIQRRIASESSRIAEQVATSNGDHNTTSQTKRSGNLKP